MKNKQLLLTMLLCGCISRMHGLIPESTISVENLPQSVQDEITRINDGSKGPELKNNEPESATTEEALEIAQNAIEDAQDAAITLFQENNALEALDTVEEAVIQTQQQIIDTQADTTVVQEVTIESLQKTIDLLQHQIEELEYKNGRLEEEIRWLELNQRANGKRYDEEMEQCKETVRQLAQPQMSILGRIKYSLSSFFNRNK